MPIFKANNHLVFYAHVPKCGGSAVSWYLQERFGPLAFNDSQHTRQAKDLRWSRTSPQHIDRASLGRLFPEGFFDAIFAIVRHPVARLVSAYHFQLDVEGSISRQTGFSDWLADLEERMTEDPFVFDNHARPISEIVPEGAQIFHMEHGLDGLVGWFDTLTGQKDGPRAVPKLNEQGQYSGDARKARPSPADLVRIETLYRADFERFGYAPDRQAPISPAPVLTPEQILERNAALKAYNSPLSKVRRKLGTHLGL